MALNGNSMRVFPFCIPYSAAIESRSYQQGLDQYNAVVTTASFSEIGSFIPGIKVLLQLGLQLKI